MSSLENLVKVSSNFLKGFDKIAGKDYLRPTTAGVYFTNGKAVATDGHKLLELDLLKYAETETETIHLLDGFFIDQEQLKEVKAAKNQTIWIGDGKIVVMSSKFKVLKTLELQKMDEVGRYPNYEAVVPSSENVKDVSRIGINPTLMIEVFNALKFANIDSIKCYLQFNGENKAVSIKHKDLSDDDFRAIVMPLAF
jgi:hypothetical protein